MNLIALMLLKDEAWVCGLSVRAALRWCDKVICLNHASTDATAEILDTIALETRRVVVSQQPDPLWAEMDHRQALLTIARQYDATHIALVDADEVLTGNMLPVIRGMIEQMPSESILTLPWLCLKNSVHAVHSTGLWGGAMVHAAFKDDPRLSWRPASDGYHFHHREPYGRVPVSHSPVWLREGGLMHLQFLSDRRLLAKQALYQMQEVIRWPDKRSAREVAQMYGRTVHAHLNGTAKPVPESWWAPYADLMQYLDIDAEPWQEAEIHRLIKEHGMEKFAGLDTFVVVK